jgi:hypothetical protein
MTDPNPGPRHEPERVYERAADPAEAVDRPLEPKSAQDELSVSDDVAGLRGEATNADPHHALNTPAGTPDPNADSDPYREPTPDDDADRASGTRGSGGGADADARRRG